MRDAALEDDRSGPERQTKFVQRIELKWEGSFDLGAAAADLLDRHRLEHHNLAVELAEDGYPFRVALLAGHRGPTIAQPL